MSNILEKWSKQKWNAGDYGHHSSEFICKYFLILNIQMDQLILISVCGLSTRQRRHEKPIHLDMRSLFTWWCRTRFSGEEDQSSHAQRKSSVHCPQTWRWKMSTCARSSTSSHAIECKWRKYWALERLSFWSLNAFISGIKLEFISH